MAVSRVHAAEVIDQAEQSLALDDVGAALFSPAGLAASVRRAASFLCPTTPSALRRAVEQSLRGLGQAEPALRDEIERTLGELVGIGDLLMLRVDSGDVAAQQVFLGTPAFVPSGPGAFLLGVRPEGAPLIAVNISSAVEHRGHIRWLAWGEGRSVEELQGEGLVEFAPDQWLAAPRATPAQSLVAELRALVDRTSDFDLIEGVRVLETARPVKYYRGRWREATASDLGYFIARRPQAYGADLWCFAHMNGSGRIRVIDLPIGNPLSSGADEAWRLQAALDGVNEAPQAAEVRPADGAQVRLSLFSPLPSWAQRRLDLTGVPDTRTKGALFSYVLAPDRADEEIAFLERMLWMKVERVQE